MNIYEAIADIMRDDTAIGKNQKNTQQGFKYRGIDDVMNTFAPLMAKRGVFVVPEVLEQTREEHTSSKGAKLLYSILKMRYTFYAEDGSSVSAVVIGEGMDSADKSSNKAMAVAMKYAMFQVFCIPTEEMRDADPDRYSPDMIEAPKNAEKGTASNKPSNYTTQTADKPKTDGNVEKTLTYAADGYLHCDACGEIIQPQTGKDGKLIRSPDIANLSLKKTGRQLCAECLKKLS